ncbi:ATP-binding cassette domain-containing protein [archaeon]|nr:MAG: ATP-binding cassette domain-containing protein [archaeon]
MVGIVGPNGAGKSTLMKFIQGVEKPDWGSIELGKSATSSCESGSRRSAINAKECV